MTVAEDYDIVGSYNNQRISGIDSERSVNCFEYFHPFAKKKKALIKTSGIIDSGIFFPLATNGFRAEFVFNEIHYVVIGDRIYSITVSNVVTFLGQINTVSGYVAVAANTYQIIFVDGESGYIFDTNSANALQIITDTSFPINPIDVCYLDGFFIVANGGTNNFYLSSFNNGLIWGPAANNFTTNFAVNSNLLIGGSTIGGVAGTDNYQTGVQVTVSSSGTLPAPLTSGTIYYSIFINTNNIQLALTYDNAILGNFINLTSDGAGIQTITSEGQLQFGSITSDTGTIVACRTLHRRLFLFSQYFTEVWENSGIGSNLPFRRNNSLLLEVGTPAIGSISVGFDKMFFLSQDRDGLGPVMEVIGAQAIPVSTIPLDSQLSDYAKENKVSDCRSFLLKENAIIFYRMNFTAANHTFVYNVSLNSPQNEASLFWHEEEMLNTDRHPSQTHAYFNGKNYVGDYKNPILYILDKNIYHNNGETIKRMRITRPLVPGGYQRIRIDRLQIDLIQGTLSQEDILNNDVYLSTEDGFILSTEDDFYLLLEQNLQVNNPSEQFIFISISKDGGQTYGNRIKAPLGNIGQRNFRTLWRKLGVTKRGQAFVAKFEYFEQTEFAILGASWAKEILPE